MPHDGHQHEHKHDHSHDDASGVGCCGAGDGAMCGDIGPIGDVDAKGRSFRVNGLDCAEEVAILNRVLGPEVGGEEHLAFDVINGRMTIVDAAESVAEKDIIKAVATTGMKATRWQPGQTQVNVSQRQRSQTLYAAISGVFILVGILIHIGMAGGFADIRNLFQSTEALSYSWQAFTDYFSSLLKSHTQQNMPPPERLLMPWLSCLAFVM